VVNKGRYPGVAAFVAGVAAGRDASGILSRPSVSGDPQTRRSSFGGPHEFTPDPLLVKPATPGHPLLV